MDDSPVLLELQALLEYEKTPAAQRLPKQPPSFVLETQDPGGTGIRGNLLICRLQKTWEKDTTRLGSTVPHGFPWLGEGGPRLLVLPG